MSSLGPGDEELHHSDGSHRWAGGPENMSLPVWQAIIRSHMQRHLAGMGGPTTTADEVAGAQPTRAERRAERWIARRRAIEQASQREAS